VLKCILEVGVGELAQLAVELPVDLAEDWFSSYDPGTRPVLRSLLKRFLAFAGSPAVELVERQKKAFGEDRYEVLKLVQTFVAQLPARRNYKRWCYSLLNQFFAYHHAAFPKDPKFVRSYQMQGVQPPTIPKLTIDNVKQIIMAAKPRDRCMILVKWHGLMGTKELEYANLHGWPQIREQLNAGADVIRIDLPPRKRSDLAYYTLIGGDAITYGLKPYLEKYGEPPKAGPMWFTEVGDPVRRVTFKGVWRGLTNRLELTPRKHNNPGTRYGYNSHDTRDLASSIWTVSGANEKVCEFLMGHPKLIDPNLYKRFWKTHPQFVVDEYRKALPHLNLISSGVEVKKHQDELKALQEDMADMKIALDALTQDVREKLMKVSTLRNQAPPRA